MPRREHSPNISGLSDGDLCSKAVDRRQTRKNPPQGFELALIATEHAASGDRVGGVNDEEHPGSGAPSLLLIDAPAKPVRAQERGVPQSVNLEASDLIELRRPGSWNLPCRP